MDPVQSVNRRIEWILGGFVFLVSFLVYFSTVAPTTSFWDCGEFIASSYILGVIHPPGAPLYLLIGRLLTMIPLFKDIGLRVNMFSVFISAMTILFTYLIIIQLIRRWRGIAKTWEDRWILYASAVIGALGFAFTDSQWFNSVEAEVYSFSIFFTAIVIWLALYWGERSEKAGSMLIILFIFYLFGLATGVHLLNILTFPFVLLIAFFHDNKTVRHLLLLLTVQAAVPLFIYVVFFQYNPDQLSQEMLEHQATAWNVFKWTAGIWTIITLIYMYYKDRKAFAAWWVLPVLGLIGYSTYLMIFVRAGMHPPINENDPSTLQGMMDYLGRKQYGQESAMLTFMHRKAPFWHYQIQMMYTRYFGWQFIGQGTHIDYHDRIVEIISFKGLYGLPFFVGIWGAVHHFSRDWKRALAVLIFFLVTGYAIIIYLNQPDPQPRERDYSYVGSFFAFSLWIGTGMAGILEWISDAMKKRGRVKKIVFGLTTLLILIAVPVNLLAFNYESHDRTGNYVAYDYSYNILQTCEPNAIIFTNGDNDTFPLWFLQEVYKIRKDVRVVNLSLLNTPWYIYQLRDEIPKINLDFEYRDPKTGVLKFNRMTDRKIDQVNYQLLREPVYYSIEVPESVRERDALQMKGRNVSADTMPHEIRWLLKPTYPEKNPMVLRVQDLMVIRIIQAARWERPVYFAVTVASENMLNMDKYLRMDGLAFKVMPYPVNDKIDPEILHDNVINKYQYRGLNDPKVHLNTNILKLLGNYRSAFVRLATTYRDEGKIDQAIEVMKKMDALMPPELIPYPSEITAVLLNNIAREMGMDIDMEKRSQMVIPGRLLSRQERRELANYYTFGYPRYDRAEEILQELIREDPGDSRVQSELFFLYRQSGQYDRAIEFLENWLQRNPGDPNALKELEELRKKVGQSAGDTTSFFE